MKYDKMLMLLTLVAAGLAAGCSDDEDPLKDWTGPSKPGTEIKTPAEVGNRVVAGMIAAALIAEREALSPLTRIHLTAELAAHLGELLDRLNPQTLGFCWPFRGEPDLREFLSL